MTKPKAFVLMPFAEPYNACYERIFKPALRDAGYEVTRADDLFAPRPIMVDIAQSIKDSDLVLCEMSGKNPNVFYELGLAHALGKPVILVSQDKEDIPFDLRHIRVLLYDYTDVEWGKKLKQGIQSAAREVQSRTHSIWPPPLFSFATDLLHRDIKVLRGRRATVDLLPEIVKRAQQSDLLFGSCNTCSDYPRAFYEELPKALVRGAKILFIAQDRPDSSGFIKQIRDLKNIGPPSHVRILKSKMAYLRLFGIEDKEAVLALPLEDEFIGLHFNEPRVPAFLKLAFDELVESAEEVE